MNGLLKPNQQSSSRPGIPTLSGSGPSNHRQVTPDGRYVVFVSEADNLVTGDNNRAEDVFRRDLRSGKTELVSRGIGGGSGNDRSRSPAVSADGRFVAFTSWASNLDPRDENHTADIFVRDMQTGTTELLSIAMGGTGGNSFSSGPTISADGRFVAFSSQAGDLVAGDNDGREDVFVRDLVDQVTRLVSITPGGTTGNHLSREPAISGNGRFVVFTSLADDLIGDDSNGTFDVFVRDLVHETTALVSRGTEATIGNSVSGSPVISFDGRFVAFRSVASNLVAGDHNATFDIFVRDTLSGTTELVSITPAGMSDGRFVAFESNAEDLVGNDSNATRDVFLRDRSNGTTALVSLSVGNVSGNGISLSPAISADGRFAVFASVADDLVSGDDNDGTVNVFLYRVPDATTLLVSAGLETRVPRGLAVVPSGRNRFFYWSIPQVETWGYLPVSLRDDCSWPGNGREPQC